MKLSLDSQRILDKVFASAPRGYSPFEVDEYLDKILNDYRLVEENELLSKKEVTLMNNKIKELEDKIVQLELENARLNRLVKNIKEGDNVTSDNIQLIQRVRTLEKWIYEHGGLPNNIK